MMKTLRDNKIGIFFDSKKMFLVQLKRKSNDITVDKIESIELPLGLIKKGVITNTKDFSRLLKNIVLKNKIKGKNVFVCVPENAVVLNTVSFPGTEEARVKSFVHSEISKLFISGEEVVFDFYRIDSEKLFVAAIRKKDADNLTQAVENSGLNVLGIDIMPLAALRLLKNKNNDSSPEETIILVLIGNDIVEISVVNDNGLIYSRNIDICNENEILKEIKATILYWQEQFPGAKIGKTVVLGDTNTAKRIYIDFPKELGVVEQLDPLDKSFGENILAYSICAGLAMRDIGNVAKYDINMISPEKVKKRELEKVILTGFAAITAVLMVCFLMTYIFSYVVGSYVNKMAPIKIGLERSGNELEELEKINQQRARIFKKIKDKENIISRTEKVPWPSVLEDIRDYMPKKMWLTEISVENDNIIMLKGGSLSRDDVYEYVNLLSFSDYFQKPALEYVDTEEEQEKIIYEFQINSFLNRETGQK